MNKSILTFLIILNTALTFGQISKKTKDYADDICGIIKKNSIFSNSIDWNSLATELKLKEECFVFSRAPRLVSSLFCYYYLPDLRNKYPTQVR
jgi:hypothetical protein